MITYNGVRKKIKEYNLTQKQFKEICGLSGGTLTRIMKDDGISTEIINRICNVFSCAPNDIMEFTPDSEYENIVEKQQRIKQLETELKKLKESK